MISIVTPCRNAESTISRTINSVLSQDGVDLEYIIIDGASTDKTCEIISKYRYADNRITLISEPDNSMTEALNKGFKRAKGELVCSINADDEYKPGVLKRVSRLFLENSCDVIVASTEFQQGDRIAFSSHPSFMTNRFLLNALDCSAPECSVFFNRRSVESAGFFDERYKFTQDYELYIRLAKNGNSFFYDPCVASVFHLSEEQYSNAFAKQMLKEALSYNEYPILFRLLKQSRMNNVIKRLFGWVRK